MVRSKDSLSLSGYPYLVRPLLGKKGRGEKQYAKMMKRVLSLMLIAPY
jgi:hypothetical protein